MVTKKQYQQAKKTIAQYEAQNIRIFERKVFKSKEVTIDFFYIPLRELKKNKSLDSRLINTLICISEFKNLADSFKYQGDIAQFRNWGDKTLAKFNILKRKYLALNKK